MSKSAPDVKAQDDDERFKEVKITCHKVEPLQGIHEIFDHFALPNRPQDIVHYMNTGLTTAQADVSLRLKLRPLFDALCAQTFFSSRSRSTKRSCLQ
jgi:hypothetical protein